MYDIIDTNFTITELINKNEHSDIHVSFSLKGSLYFKEN